MGTRARGNKRRRAACKSSCFAECVGTRGRSSLEEILEGGPAQATDQEQGASTTLHSNADTRTPSFAKLRPSDQHTSRASPRQVGKVVRCNSRLLRNTPMQDQEIREHDVSGEYHKGTRARHKERSGLRFGFLPNCNRQRVLVLHHQRQDTLHREPGSCANQSEGSRRRDYGHTKGDSVLVVHQ